MKEDLSNFNRIEKVPQEDDYDVVIKVGRLLGNISIKFAIRQLIKQGPNDEGMSLQQVNYKENHISEILILLILGFHIALTCFEEMNRIWIPNSFETAADLGKIEIPKGIHCAFNFSIIFKEMHMRFQNVERDITKSKL